MPLLEVEESARTGIRRRQMLLLEKVEVEVRKGLDLWQQPSETVVRAARHHWSPAAAPPGG